MGFFDDLKKEISQAVTELVSDEELLKEEDGYDAGLENMVSKTAKAADTDYFDEDDYIETEEDFAEDVQPSKVVVDDLASDEYVNTMKIDLKDLIASYSNELSGNMEEQNSGEDSEESYRDSYESSYNSGYDSQFAVDEPTDTSSADKLLENEEAAETMAAMETLGFANDLAQMYGDDDDVMVNTLDDEVFANPVQEPEEQPNEPAEPEEDTVEESPVEEQPTESISEEAQTAENADEPAIEDWVTEEPLPDDFEEENSIAEETVSREPIMEEEVLETFKEPVMKEPEIIEKPIVEELPVTEEPVIKEKPARTRAAKTKRIAEEEPAAAKEEKTIEKTAAKAEKTKPEAKEEPKLAAEEPETKEEPKLAATEEPEIKEEPKPVATKEPIMTEKTSKTRGAAKTEPVVMEEPAKAEPETVIEEPAAEEPVIIAKTQSEEKKVKREVNEVMEEQEDVLMPAYGADMPNERDILQEMAEYSDETTVITKGVVIKGDIISGGSINVLGEVEGNITCKGKLMVNGTIHGNAEAGELFANDAHITGNILNAGSVKIGQGSIIIGNVTGSSAVIAGAIKGDIDVKGPVVIDSTAIIMGDIKSKSVQINNGAAIEGRCSQCYADVNPTSFFKEN